MSRRARARRRNEPARGANRMPAHGAARVRGAPVTAGPGRWSARGAAGDWVLLPGGTWRRVETIRVRALFG
ncbi:hypothetical protein [Streptomyces sp. NPDC007905]|uniref:hypothetical protein n=1 Tax=Streptomyces sp. NPDC007905 TaxID=3364788 RepID=UPI0036ECE398